jgi:hypothetical protein
VTLGLNSDFSIHMSPRVQTLCMAVVPVLSNFPCESTERNRTDRDIPIQIDSSIPNLSALLSC